MRQEELNEQEWRNPNNWKLFSIYYSEYDSRVWVPKRIKWMGWTLNFAKKQSYIWLFVLIVVPMIIVLFVASR